MLGSARSPPGPGGATNAKPSACGTTRRSMRLTHGMGLIREEPGSDAVIEPAVIELVLRALPDPVALVESAVRRGRMQHRLQWATPARSEERRVGKECRL